MRLRSGRVIGDIEVNGRNSEVSVSEPNSFNSKFVAESEDRPANLLAVDLFDSCSDSIFDNLFEINSEPNMTTLRELAAPNLNVQPLSITYAELEKPLKLNSGFINLLPKFHGSLKFDKAMLDLGSSINVMPKDIFEQLHIGDLKRTGVVIQLADRSHTYPEGILEDVLVRVNDFIFHADFYILDMGVDKTDIPILLGRPFLKTARAKIDVHGGTLTMEFDGEIIKFSLSEAMKHPHEENQVFAMDVIDKITEEVFSKSNDDALYTVLTESLDPFEIEKLNFSLPDDVCFYAENLSSVEEVKTEFGNP
ncbi:unnamed protein product [Cuscuta campestris]|uniref:Aspartic peptidase DDI1-type domain-containing protein n=1 Tax=Cuscuta campestris TaxID=132261 RepID=A0A484N5P3_9ASTE|nr:unnamed protein product [Cuscuta campestris]